MARVMSAEIRTINIYLFITQLLPSVVGPGCTEGSYGKINQHLS